MLIINPIYDSAFKYLMDHTDIAKGIISLLIGETVLELEHRSQETVSKVNIGGELLDAYRMDFNAKILTKNNQEKQVLIELQKSRLHKDVLRFRKYLGMNYQRHETRSIMPEKRRKNQKALTENYAIPIISIYFLGYPLSKKVRFPVIAVRRQYIDVIGKSVVKWKNPFIENLTHDAYFIQLPYVHEPYQSRLEYILSVFDQHYKDSKDRKLLQYRDLIPEEEQKDELMSRLLNVLHNATLNQELRSKMELEESEQTAIDNRFMKQKAKYLKEIEAKEAEAKKQKAEARKQKAEAEKQKAEAEKQKAEAEKQKAEAEKQKAEAEKQKAEAEKQKAEAEKQKSEIEKMREDKQKAEKQLYETLFNLHHNLGLPLPQIAQAYQMTEEEVQNLLNQ